MDTAYDDHDIIRIGRHEYEVEASNLARRNYADEFREADSKSLTGDEEQDAGKYTGHLIQDLLLDHQRMLSAGIRWPEWDEVPRILATIWAMAHAAGSVKVGWQEFCASIEHEPANLYEVAIATNRVLELGKLSFFRLDDGPGDAQKPDDADTATGE